MPDSHAWTFAVRACAVLLAAGGGAVAAFAVLDRAFPPDLSRMERAGVEVLDREGRTLLVQPAPGGVWRLRTGAEQVAPGFLALLVRTEDRRFYAHHGVDMRAILRAAWQGVRAGRVVSGGSTLSMQAARLLEPRPRTLRSKVIEAFRAVQLEERFGKRGVLGIWLTLAPYGGNLEGVRAASWAWFGKRPAALDAAEAALLVAIPRRPEALRPDRHPGRALALRDRLLAGEDRGEALPGARVPFPRHAEPALRRLPGAAVDGMATTLDLALQEAAERLVAERLARQPAGVSMAVLVADVRSRAVLAAVSGAGGAARAGAADLTAAVRSPGSALKPLLYGMAFEDGLVSPATPVSDLPRHFGGYAPENFDRGFAGPVSAADALRRSLNLPAVALLERLGPGRFAARLGAAGAPLRLPAGAVASLPLALGGAGVSLRALLRLYAALGTDGASAGLRWAGGNADEPALPLLQPSAARLVAGILTRDFPGGGPSGVAWKTGTSWGGRDAWALGFDGRHVAGVWMGRPDGTAVPGFTGAGTALPVLAGVFGLLPPAPREAAPGDAPAAPVAAAPVVSLLFPPPGATLSADGPVPLRASGGRRPLLFAVDGRPVPSAPAGRATAWTPDGPGFYTVTVQDADGALARAQVRVR